MKTSEKVIVGLAALAIGGIIVFAVTRPAQATPPPNEPPAGCPWT
jgi:hypothetical protein